MEGSGEECFFVLVESGLRTETFQVRFDPSGFGILTMPRVCGSQVREAKRNTVYSVGGEKVVFLATEKRDLDGATKVYAQKVN